MDLFDLVAKITVDTSDFNDKIDQAAESAEGLSGVIDSLAGGVLQGLADGLREAAEAGEDIEELDNAISGLAQEFVSGEKNGKEFLSALADMAKEAGESKDDLKDVKEKTDDVGEAEEKASKKTKVFGDMLKANLVSSAVTKGLGLLVTGIRKLGSAMASVIPEVAEYGDHIDKQSQKLGISAKAYQEWDAVMQHSGTSIDSAVASMKTLTTSVQAGSEETVAALDKIGISIDDAAKMSQEDLFSNVITGLQNMEAGAEKTAAAAKLLGRGAMEMGALLNTSAADTQAMKDRVNELGGVLSEWDVKWAAGFQDSLQDMMTAIDGLKNKFAAKFLRAAFSVMDGITLIIEGNTEAGTDLIEDGINEFATKLNELLPTLLQTIDTIIQAIAQAIQNNSDTISNALINLVQIVGPVIAPALGTIVDMAAAVLPDIITTLTPAIVDGVIQIIDGVGDVLAERIPALGLLFDNLPVVIEAAFAGKSIIAVSNFAGAITNLTSLMGLAGGAEGAGLLATGLGSIGTLITGTIVPALGSIGTVITGTLLPAIGPFLIGGAIVAGIVAGVMLIVKNWDKIKEAAGKLGEAVSEKWEAIKTKTSEIWGNVSQAVSDKLEQAKEYAQKKLDKIKEAYDKHGGGIEGIAAATMEGVKQYYSIGWDAVNKLTGGKLGELADKLKEGLEEARKKFFEFIDKAKDWGKDLIQNFIDGIKQKWEDLKKGVKDVGQTIKNFLGFSEPKEGPLSDFHTYAPDMVDLFIRGLQENTKRLRNQVASSFDFSGLSEAPEMPDVKGMEVLVDFNTRALEGAKKALNAISVPMEYVNGADSIKTPKVPVEYQVPQFPLKAIREQLGLSIETKNIGVEGKANESGIDGVFTGLSRAVDRLAKTLDVVAGDSMYTRNESVYNQSEISTNNYTRAGNTTNHVSINVYGAQGQDVETLADLVADKVSNIIYTTGERRAMALG